MPTVPKKSLEFALVLILAHLNARLYRPCEPRMAQTQNPFKLVDRLRLRHTLSAFQRVGMRMFEHSCGLRMVITSGRLNAIFGTILAGLLRFVLKQPTIKSPLLGRQNRPQRHGRAATENDDGAVEVGVVGGDPRLGFGKKARQGGEGPAWQFAA